MFHKSLSVFIQQLTLNYWCLPWHYPLQEFWIW